MPRRGTSTRSRPAGGSGSATPAACAPGWRPTPTRTTSTDCSPAWPTSSPPADAAGDSGEVVAGYHPGRGQRTAAPGRTPPGGRQPVGVAGRVAADVQQVVVRGLPEHLGGDAPDNRPGRHLGAGGDDGACGDDGARPDVRAVHDHAAHADEHVV